MPSMFKWQNVRSKTKTHVGVIINVIYGIDLLWMQWILWSLLCGWIVL